MRWIFILIVCAPLHGFAQLRLAKIFSDHMIVQRDQPVHIWGNATPGERIVAAFAGEKRSSLVQPDSSWSIYFGKQRVSTTPQTLMISSKNEQIELKNLLIGDVWLCLGQSNMQFSMQEEMHYKEEIKNSDQPLLRFYNPDFIGKNVFNRSFSDSMVQRLNVKDFYSPASWQTCDSNSFKAMTAVGYYFGKEILKQENIPVGLIHLAIGGCPIETFISKDALQNSLQFSAKTVGNWLINDALPVWIRERGKQNVGKIPGVKSDEGGPNHGYKPGFAFASGIEPILALPIKGVIWYQGESNAQELERVNEYAALQELMIKDYRTKWHQPEMPFYWVQLSSIDTANYKSQLWPDFRNEQRLLLSRVKNGGMAVCSDIGLKNNVHPTNKKSVGERLARWALNHTHGENIIPSGPLPAAAKYRKGRVIISFEYASGDLQTADGKSPRGFSLDGKADAGALIDGKRVLIPSKEKPAYIYYAWKPFTDANLVNTALLPASTFKIKVK